MLGNASRKHCTTTALVVFGLSLGGLVLPLTGPAGAASPAAPASGDPIKLMMIYEGSAGVGGSPTLPEGAVAAVRAINKAGGVGGRRLVLIKCDTKNDPNQAAACGRKAVDQGVVALVGDLTTYGDQFLPLMQENKIPSIGTLTSNTTDFISPASFPIGGGAIATFANLPRFLADEGAKKIALVRIDLGAAAAATAIGNKGLASTGLKITNEVPVPTTAPDMSTYVAAALAGGTDGIVVILPGQQALQFVQAARQAAPDVKLALASTEAGPVTKALGPQVKGVVQALDSIPTPPVRIPAGRQFAKEMRAAGYDELGGFAPNSWLSVRAFADLAKGLPEVTAPATFDKLEQTTGLATGLTPPLQWTTGGVGGIPRIFTGCQMSVRLTAKGVQKPVTGKFFDSFTNAECPTP